MTHLLRWYLRIFRPRLYARWQRRVIYLLLKAVTEFDFRAHPLIALIRPAKWPKEVWEYETPASRHERETP